MIEMFNAVEINIIVQDTLMIVITEIFCHYEYDVTDGRWIISDDGGKGHLVIYDSPTIFQ